MTWLEALPPLIIITASLGAMGSLQGYVHRLYYGRVKRVQCDYFDFLLDKRDDELRSSDKDYIDVEKK